MSTPRTSQPHRTKLAVMAALGLIALGALPPASSLAAANTTVTVTLEKPGDDPLANYPSDFATETRNLKANYRCGGTWADATSVQTDESGRFTIDVDCASDNWDGKITLTLNQTTQEKVVVDDAVTFTTAMVDANLKTCSGLVTDAPGGTVAQGGGYWYDHGQTGSSGTVSFFALPGDNVKVRMTYNHDAEIVESFTVVAGVNDIDFNATKVTTSYPDDIKSNKGGSWWYFDKPAMNLLPGDYSFYFRNGGSWDGPQTVTVSGCNQVLVGPATGDGIAPTADPIQSPAANGAGWSNEDVTVTWHWSDNAGGSGIDNANCTTSTVSTGEGDPIMLTASCKDNAGNTGHATYSVRVDKTTPSVSLVDGPVDGGDYLFGSVPAEPTCSASDALSGLDGPCGVSGFETPVGSHTVKAVAFDKAGNKGVDTADYVVTGWTLEGFFTPVDMDSLNVVKAGSTVPLKFRVFAGATELTDPAVVADLKARRTDCDGGETEEIPEDLTTTGATSLRYADDQFIYNWKTAKDKAGLCFVVTVSTVDGSKISADFKLK